MQLAIFPFERISTIDLEGLARRSVLNGKLRKRGGSESRYRSYLAGRSALTFLFALNDAAFCVAPNAKFGFLEVFDAAGFPVGKSFVNVSHTENVSVAVFSNSPVGVDVESKTRSAERVLGRIATDAERGWVSASRFVSPRFKIPRDIFLWSSKESASK